MAKTYPLEIRELREFEGGHLGWWSRGHQEKAAFADTLVQGEHISQHDADYFTEDGPITDYIRHEYWRCVPIPGESFTCTFNALPGTRGAFPVTVVEDV